MGDPILMTVVGVGAALTKLFLRACDAVSAADLVEDGQDLFGAVSRVSRRSDGSRDQIERGVSRALAARIQEMHKHRCGQDIDGQLLSGACTEVEIILNEIADDGELILSAVLNPDSLPVVFHSRASQRRLNIEEAAEPYFDELNEAVATQYAALVPWSTRFQIEAFKSILSANDENRDYHRRSLHAHDITHEMLAALPTKLAEATRHEDKPSRVFFGSRPEVVAENRFVERSEQEHLNALMADPRKRRTVLVGMRGCGKTQLASTLAQQCEDAHWSLVAWVNASSTESITSDLVELARELKIDTSDQPAPEDIIRRLFTRLKSADPSDRLIVFDNVENIDDLLGFVPRCKGLRVVVTTTNKAGWEDQGWNSVKVGVFEREKSIDYLLKVTKSDDRDVADALAERLGCLPLAIAQAAATAHNEHWTLQYYFNCLEEYDLARVIHPVQGDSYTQGVASALALAVDTAIKHLVRGTPGTARRQLGGLAVLAESGVPTRWLDPLTDPRNEAELLEADQDVANDAHLTLAELIHRSIVHQSADKATTMLHRLQAQAFRESWTACQRTDASESAAALLGSVDIDSFDRTDTESRLRETRSLIEQIHAISEQGHSKSLFKYEQIALILSHTLSHARDLGILYEALALEEPVLATLNMAQLDEIAALNLKEQLAYTYMYAEQFNEAFDLYAEVIADRTAIQGHDHRDTLTSRNNLAYAYQAAGRLREAIALYEQVLTDRTRVLGKDHPHTLASRNNLAGAYQAAGRLREAIALYEQVLPDSIRVLGEDHPHTLTSRHNLAGAYASDSNLPEAIVRWQALCADCLHILGPDHPLTVTVRENLEAARRELAQHEEDSAAE